MPGPLAGPLIVAGASLAGGAITAGSTASMNKKSRRFSEHMYNRQKADNIEFWHMQNDYNSPQSQMKRFQEAGLNPNLIYGQGNSGPAGAISTPDVQSPQWRTPEWGNAISDAGLGYVNALYDLDIKQAQVDNLKAQNTVILEDALYRRMQIEASIAGTERTRVGTERDMFDLSFKRDMADTDADFRREQVRSLRTQTDLSINKDAREAALNASNVKEAAERMLSLREGRAKSREERYQIRQSVQNMIKDGVIKDIEIGLRRNNINPNDPMWARIVGKMLSDYFDSGGDIRSKGIWKFLFD